MYMMSVYLQHVVHNPPIRCIYVILCWGDTSCIWTFAWKHEGTLSLQLLCGLISNIIVEQIGEKPY